MRERTWSSAEPDRGCILKLGGHMPLHMWYLYTICLFLFTSVFGKHDHMTCHMIFHCSSYSGSLPINCCNDLGHLWVEYLHQKFIYYLYILQISRGDINPLHMIFGEF